MTEAEIRERSASGQSKTRVRWWIFVLIALFATVAGISYWWGSGGREELFLALQPGFQVVKIDSANKTMVITRMNESYLVSCEGSCDLFTIGKTYTIRERAGVFEVLRKRQRIQLPILREHIEFETAPGGHG